MAAGPQFVIFVVSVCQGLCHTAILIAERPALSFDGRDFTALIIIIFFTAQGHLLREVVDPATGRFYLGLFLYVADNTQVREKQSVKTGQAFLPQVNFEVHYCEFNFVIEGLHATSA